MSLMLATVINSNYLTAQGRPDATVISR